MDDFKRPPQLGIYLLTFNCGRNPIQPELFATHLLSALNSNKAHLLPDLLVLSLQEIAPLAHSFLGGTLLTSYYSNFQDAVKIASSQFKGYDEGKDFYELVHAHNVGMTAIMVFVKRSSASSVESLQTAGVGLGWWQMGNKGAAAVRIGYSTEKCKNDTKPMEVTFVAAHFTAGESMLSKRHQNYYHMCEKLVFEPGLGMSSGATIETPTNTESTSEEQPLLSRVSDSQSPSGIYNKTSHLYLLGDLNYRTSSSAPTASDFEHFPQPTDSPNDPKHYSDLLLKDQLTLEREAGRTCCGMQEMAIQFPPTYKYEPDQAPTRGPDGKKKTWLWARHRWPSWCDRILFLDLPNWAAPKRGGYNTLLMEIDSYKALPLMPTSDHQPVAMSLAIALLPIPTPEAGTQPRSLVDDLRLNPPPMDPTWKQQRKWARRREIAVGLAAYATTTWQGRVILLAVVCAAGGICWAMWGNH
ncbi:MAG: hypothetical protein M1829_003375 [Trizodia sp. TS-e1964]|nr:MAG: hypothetical protein M1829_003375 [Trizodia sp. TS-e1964]